MKSGKCSNFGNCALADAHTVIETPSGVDFVCTECGKPLLLSAASSAGAAAGGSGNNQTVRIAALAVIVVALVGGGAWFMLHGEKHPTPPPPTVEVPTPVPAMPAHPPQVHSGNCSDVDAKAGLCKKK